MKIFLCGLLVLGSLSVNAASKECVEAIDLVNETSGKYGIFLMLKDKRPGSYKVIEDAYRAEKELEQAYDQAFKLCTTIKCAEAINLLNEKSGKYGIYLMLKDERPGDYKVIEDAYRAEKELKQAYNEALELCE
jgi:hypothetical protein